MARNDHSKKEPYFSEVTWGRPHDETQRAEERPGAERPEPDNPERDHPESEHPERAVEAAGGERRDHEPRARPASESREGGARQAEEEERAARAGSEPAPRAAARPEPSEPQDPPAEAEAAAGMAAASPGDRQAAERIASLEVELAELKDRALRAMAEVENVRRRSRKELEEKSKYAIFDLAKDLLAAPDNLRRALDSIPAEGRRSDVLLDRLASGVELVERDLHAVLERYGIKRIDPLGQPFDHNFHQALFEVPTSEQPAGTVVQVLAPGYVIHDRLLRPAMVGVAKAASGEGAGGGARVDTTA
jgi:molecular chaperone GrpE